jgi:phosphatidylglycerol:prolipoprotein diacylglycerol transferase
MLHYPSINPVAFQIGFLRVHWYGLMYLVGFVGAWILAIYRARRPSSGWNIPQVNDLIFYAAMGVIVGGRLGYVLFYDFTDFITHPWRVFQVWQGGMSFHGGLIGVGIALLIYSRKFKKNWIDVIDFTAPLVPIGLGAGRLGNFINGELWGRVTTAPWGMIFPEGGPQPRHPSQLYELLLEGILLFIIVWGFSNKRRPRGSVTALFIICYGAFRFFVEFFRQPDPQLGFILFGWMTRGQELSIPMIIIGLIWFFIAYQRDKTV